VTTGHRGVKWPGKNSRWQGERKIVRDQRTFKTGQGFLLVPRNKGTNGNWSILGKGNRAKKGRQARRPTLKARRSFLVTSLSRRYFSQENAGKGTVFSRGDAQAVRIKTSAGGAARGQQIHTAPQTGQSHGRAGSTCTLKGLGGVPNVLWAEGRKVAEVELRGKPPVRSPLQRDASAT